MKSLIQVDHLTYQHPGTESQVAPALNDISFAIEEGEFVALVGANGSGKTTLARHLNALLTPSSGTVVVDGSDTRDQHLHQKIRSNIGMVFQHPEDQIVASIVEEDVAFGPENLCHLPAVIRGEVDQALKIVNMSENRRRQPHLLSAGQMQRVALAGVLAMQPRCIIFDETTAMLDPAGRRDVLNRMADLNRMGMTILFITHFMEEVILARRALLLNQGRLAFDGTPQALFANTDLINDSGLERPAADRLLAAFPSLFPAIKTASSDMNQLLEAIPVYTGSARPIPMDAAKNEAAPGEIEIHDLSHVYMVDTPLAHQSLVNVSMEVKKGVPHGLVGATGSGKSTLLQHLNGLYLPQHGTIRIGPFDLNSPEVNVKALRQYAGLVFQNPELYFFEQYVGDEIAFGPRAHKVADVRESVRWAMNMVGLDFDLFKDRITSTLSGGEQRKVALAATLASHPALLILDEPTAGLDPVSRRKLLSNLNQLQDQGTQVIFSSHNMDDIAEMVQNITILSKGSTLVNLPVYQAFTDREMLLGAGLEQPSSVRFAQALRYRGWPIAQSTVTMQALGREIRRALEGEANE